MDRGLTNPILLIIFVCESVLLAEITFLLPEQARQITALLLSYLAEIEIGLQL